MKDYTSIRCWSCTKHFQVREEVLGQTVPCPHCGCPSATRIPISSNEIAEALAFASNDGKSAPIMIRAKKRPRGPVLVICCMFGIALLIVVMVALSKRPIRGSSISEDSNKQNSTVATQSVGDVDFLWRQDISRVQGIEVFDATVFRDAYGQIRMRGRIKNVTQRRRDLTVRISFNRDTSTSPHSQFGSVDVVVGAIRPGESLAFDQPYLGNWENGKPIIRVLATEAQAPRVPSPTLAVPTVLFGMSVMFVLWLGLWLCGAFLFGWLGMLCAKSRCRERAGFWLGFLLGPGGCIIALLLPAPIEALSESISRRQNASGLVEQERFCSSCGYNLRGNTTGVCPECGKQV